MTKTASLKEVPLHQRHIELGARMTPFAGYSMPVQYSSIKDEHLAVRSLAGLFDVSHMGRVEIKGPQAVEAVDRLMTNDVKSLRDGKALYTVMCNPEGGIVDDLVIYRLSHKRLLLCINAANREAVASHIDRYMVGDAEVDDRSESTVQLALQGPKSKEVLGQYTELDLDSLKFFRCVEGEVAGVATLVARTGYTGEAGFELYFPAAQAKVVWDALLDSPDVIACGLGCRDTLRLEAGLLLHGQDIDASTDPLEAGLGWLVKFDAKGDFVGRKALEKIQSGGLNRRLRGFVLEGRGVMRPGYTIESEGEAVGALTSGSYAPTLEASIGLGYIDSGFDDRSRVDVVIRGRRVEARVVDPPFYERSK